MVGPLKARMYRYSATALMLVSMCIFSLPSFSQKPNIDSTVFGKWPEVANPAISNNGVYALYNIRNEPVNSTSMVLVATRQNWELKIPRVIFGRFSQDSKHLIFTKLHDTLGIVRLGNSKINYISNVQSYLIPEKGSSSWIAYLTLDSLKTLHVVNLNTGQSRSYTQIINYKFDLLGKYLVTQRKNGSSGHLLNLLDLEKLTEKQLWSGNQCQDFVLSADGHKLAFLTVASKGVSSEHNLWLYQLGDVNARQLKIDGFHNANDTLQINRLKGFNNDGNRIYIDLLKVSASASPTTENTLHIWNFNDIKLQSQRLNESTNPPFGLHNGHFTAVYNITAADLIRLEYDNTYLGAFNPLQQLKDDWLLMRHQGAGDLHESKWNMQSGSRMFLISTSNGQTKSIPNSDSYNGSLSIDGRFVVWYNSSLKNYFSYDIEFDRTVNLTDNISTEWITAGNDVVDAADHIAGIAGWLGDGSMLLYDQFDLWQVSLRNKYMPIDLTKRYGRNHHTILRLACEPFNDLNNKFLLLSSFNLDTKEEGFFAAQCYKSEVPKLLLESAHSFKGPGDNLDIVSFAPLKARDADGYIFRQMSAMQSANYYYTTDFSKMKQLSAVYPERKYNWITSELVSWRDSNGVKIQGLLYKPENFDPQLKYPIIFYCYEKLSNELNGYFLPKPCDGGINIPYFVSRGYIIFRPDIHYDIGKPGESAYNSIISGYNYIINNKWVDKEKIGLQGMSFGGYEANFLATHTTIFKAIMSACGTSNIVSGYGSLFREDKSSQFYYEIGQGRMGGTLWDRPGLYVKNSPIFQANRVTSPILIMNNRNDDAVRFEQGVEFFNAMRRLGKKAWMLQYEHEGHGLLNWQNQIDYTVRVEQFFDHYLKDAPIPIWMSVPGNTSKELEPPGAEIDSKILKPEEKQKIDFLNQQKPVTITIP